MLNSKSVANIALISAFSLTMISCTKEESGTLLGAIGGALIGSELSGDSGIGIALGSLAGAYAGREIGSQLDEADQLKMRQTAQSALETGVSGKAAQWHNPDSGNSGSITPQPSFTNTDGQYCREYQQSVTIAGKPETAYGTACRQPDGSWKIINS